MREHDGYDLLETVAESSLIRSNALWISEAAGSLALGISEGDYLAISTPVSLGADVDIAGGLYVNIRI